MDEQASTPHWASDPTGRHGRRFWDGRAWTDHVADGVTLSVDPLTVPGATPGTPLPEHRGTGAGRALRLPAGWSLGPAVLAGSAALVVVGAISLVALQDPTPDTLTIDPGPTVASSAPTSPTAPVTSATGSTSAGRTADTTRPGTTTRRAAATTVTVRPTTRPASTTAAPTTAPTRTPATTAATRPTTSSTSSATSSRTTTPTSATTTKTGLDPVFISCAQAKRNGYGPYYRGKNPEYYFYPDPDNDGIACP